MRLHRAHRRAHFNKDEYDADFDWDQHCPNCNSDHETAPWPIWRLSWLHTLPRLQRDRQYPQKRGRVLSAGRSSPPALPSAAPATSSPENPALAKPSSPAPPSPNATSSSTTLTKSTPSIPTTPDPLRQKAPPRPQGRRRKNRHQENYRRKNSNQEKSGPKEKKVIP